MLQYIETKKSDTINSQALAEKPLLSTRRPSIVHGRYFTFQYSKFVKTETINFHALAEKHPG